MWKPINDWHARACAEERPAWVAIVEFNLVGRSPTVSPSTRPRPPICEAVPGCWLHTLGGLDRSRGQVVGLWVTWQTVKQILDV